MLRICIAILVLLAFRSGVFACPVITSVDIVPATCPNSFDGSLTINVTGTAPFQYSLDGGATFTGNSSFSGLLPGVYIIAVESSLPCIEYDTVVIGSSSFLSASFFVNSQEAFVGEPFLFVDESYGASSLVWDFGDGNTDTTNNPEYSFSLAGSYQVILNISDGFCTDTFSILLNVRSQSSLVVPNVFTPNADGQNDFFRPTAIGIEELTGIIYNRYGEIVHKWAGSGGGWDGHTFPAGLPVPEGTYFYQIDATGKDGQTFSERGMLTLIR